MIRRVLLFLMLAGFASGQETDRATFVSEYDLDATSYTYCVTTGAADNPNGPPREGRFRIKTSGSTTTVTDATSGENAFEGLSVGDVLLIHNYDTASDGTRPDVRYITAKASDASVTVDAAIDIENSGTGRRFQWLKVSCGTGATNGWVNVARYSMVKVLWRIDQMNATSIDVQVQCKDETFNTQPTTVYPDPSDTSTQECHTGNFTAVKGCALIVTGVWDACRIGFKINTDDGGDTGANAESITASVRVRR